MTPNHEGRSAARWVGVIAAAVIAAWVTAQLAPRVPASPKLAFTFAFICVSAGTWAAAIHTPTAGHRPWLSLGLSLLGLLAVRMLSNPSGALGQVASAVVLACLLTAGTLVGSAVGQRIEAAGHLVFVALVSSAVDMVSVLSPQGPTATLIATPGAMNLLALPWPMLGTRDIPPILGVGDVVFVALYQAAAVRHDLPPGRVALAIGLGLTLTLGGLLWLERPLPALPFLGLALVLLVPQTRRVPAADRVRGWLGVALLVVVLAIATRYRP